MNYPNGKTALIVTEAPNHKNRYFLFDNDKNGTCLLSIDENAIGFVVSSCKKSFDNSGVRISLSKVGCIVSNKEGDIQHEWKWDRSAQNSGRPPSGYVLVRLNEFFEFRLKDRCDMILEFRNDSEKQSFDVSLKYSRADTYLENATKGAGGKLFPKIDHVSLKSRQVDFNEKMRAQRNKLHPKSENLSELVRDIVTDLETNFNQISNKLETKVHFGAEWKNQALNQTISEIPSISMNGTEVGTTSGFGDQIYSQDDNNNPLRKTAPAALMTRTGQWRGDVEVREHLRETNPPLKRSAMLGVASGRYSEVIVVDPELVSADNLQGKTQVSGLSLERMRWRDLKNTLMQCDSTPTSPIFVILLYRSGDPNGLIYDNVARIVHERLHHPPRTRKVSVDRIQPNTSQQFSRKSSSGKSIASRFRMVRVDVSEDTSVISELGLKYLPTFIMRRGNSLLYSGLFGGRRFKPTTQSFVRPQVLLIEPNFKEQIEAEKILRRCDCDVYLSLNIQQAIDNIQHMLNSENPRPYDIILISDELQTFDVSNLAQKLSPFTKLNQTIVCGYMSLHSLHNIEEGILSQVNWDHFCSEDVSLLLSSPLSKAVSVVTKKPLKSKAVEVLLSMRTPSAHSEFSIGLTAENLFEKMLEVEESNARKMGKSISATNSMVGIRLTAEECSFKGVKLVSSDFSSSS